MVLVGFTFGAGLASEQVVVQGQVTAEDGGGNKVLVIGSFRIIE